MSNEYVVINALKALASIISTLTVGYKYGNLALQFGGVSDETVKYGYGF
jgi:hypothetical protein